MYEWDENKREANNIKHGIDFSIVEKFVWDGAIIVNDSRNDYNEVRYSATGFIGKRLYRLIFTMRGNDIRVISLRKTNKRERREYERKT